VVYIRVHSSTTVRDYWKPNQLHPACPCGEYIGQVQFQEISSYFCIFSSEFPIIAITGCKLWHSKLLLILVPNHECLQWYVVSSTYCSIIPCIMTATALSPDMYTMPSKSVLQGLKFHYLADNGYIWNFHSIANLTGPNSNNVDSAVPCFERLNEDLCINVCRIARPFSNGYLSALNFLRQDLGKY